MTDPAPSESKPLTFRPPASSTTTKSTADPSFTPPTQQFIHGQWHVLHSTLPMWKKSRNVSITYTPLDTQPGAWDNLVTYQPISSDKQKTVRGIESPHPDVPAKWKWRGKGMLKIASSEWEVLGWGEDEGGWMVIWFEKTLFTPEGMDLLGRRKDGVSEGVVGRVKEGLRAIGVGEHVGKMFEVKRD